MCRKVVFFALRIALCSAFGWSGAWASQLSDDAYELLHERVVQSTASFTIYQDADSAFNHGYPSGFFGQIQKIHLNPACLYSSSEPSGCCQSSVCLDRGRGNVLSVQFDPLAPGQYAGVNWEEPERWSAHGYPPASGYDLRGALKIVFDASSPTPGGIRVQFGLGGGVSEWKTVASPATFEIPISSLSPVPNLVSVHILFSVVTNYQNAPGGGVLLLDNIRLEPAPTASVPAGSRSLPLSTQTFGVVSAASEPFPLDQVVRNVASTYESAVTILALLARGQATDMASARSVADAMVYALLNDNLGRPLPSAPDGSRGLHNAYSAGELALLNDQYGGGAQAGNSRLAGFTVPLETGAQYWLLMDGATGGNNAFAILALVSAYQALGEVKYLDAAREVGNWIYHSLLDPDASGFGGYLLGMADSPAPPGTLVRGKSTENNADIFAAFMALSQAHPSERQEWERRANIAGDFVMAMFDTDAGRFNAGTVPAGTEAGTGIDPTGPVRGNDVTNVHDFLDASSFPVLAMSHTPRYGSQIDWLRPVRHIAGSFAQSVPTLGYWFVGFGLDGGAPGIAWEFTAQAVAAMRLADRIYRQSEFASSADVYLGELRNAQTYAPFGDGRGLVAATVPNVELLPPVDQCLVTPHQRIPARPGLAATAWAIFADRDINVLAPRRVAAINNRDALHPLAQAAAGGFLFRFAGRVSYVDAAGFALSDGSPSSLRVLAAGHTVATGDIVEVTGSLDATASPAVVIAPLGLIVKH